MLAKQHITLFMAIVLLTMSGGVSLYSHFCAGEDITVVSLTEVNHTCKTDVEQSCHNLGNDCKDAGDCCTSDVEHELANQVTIQLVAFKAMLIKTPVVMLTTLRLIETQPVSFKFYRPPPSPKGRDITVGLERFLC